MHIKWLDRGVGSGAFAANYLLAVRDHLSEVRAEVRVLRGNPRLTGELIDSLTTKYRYSSGVVAWAPEDQPTDAEIRDVLDDLERVVFAGLRTDQYSWCLVQHRDYDGGVHVHVLVARVELTSGRAMNPAPPGWQKHYDPLRDYWNYTKGWARPDDPARAKPVQLGRMTPVAASQLRAGLQVEPDPRLSITDWLISRVQSGLVRDRADVVASLAELGEINRVGGDYVSVRLTPGAKPIRLKGAIYVDTFNSESFLSVRAAASRPGTDPAPARRPDAEAARAARQRLEEAVLRRAAFNTKRFGTPPRRAPHVAPTDGEADALAIALADRGDGSDVVADRARRRRLDELPARPGRPGASRTRPGKRQSGRAATGSATSSTTTPQKAKVTNDRNRNHDLRVQHERDRTGVGTTAAAAARAAAGRASTLARAQTLDGVQRLSRFAMAQVKERPSVLLPTDALDRVVNGGANRTDGLRSTPPEALGLGGLGMSDSIDADMSSEALQARAKREGRRKAEASAALKAALKAELESATRTQLQKLRQVLAGELRAADDNAIDRLLTRITRLVFRVLSAGLVILPPTEAERRVIVARHTIEQIDAELQLRTDAATNGPRRARAPTAPIPLRIVRAHDARQQNHDGHDPESTGQHKHERNTK